MNANRGDPQDASCPAVTCLIEEAGGILYGGVGSIIFDKLVSAGWVVAVLYGRAVEQSVIGQLLAGACAGRSGVLVVRGDPGIGKTALLDYAARSAGAAAGAGGAGMRVIRGRGVEFVGATADFDVWASARPAATRPSVVAAARANRRLRGLRCSVVCFTAEPPPLSR